MDSDFVIQKPLDHFLSTLVDYYFFIDVPVGTSFDEEYVIPFPRITFGFFFDHPFSVTNHNLNQSATAEMIISRITTHTISVSPLSSRVKIVGAHIRPYALAYLTNVPIANLPWLVNTEDLFQNQAPIFRERIMACKRPTQVFAEVERVFLASLLTKDLSVITEAVNIIEERYGDIKLSEVAARVGVSGRTLRNQFYRNIGCTPKEYVHLTKLKNAVYQMKYSDKPLTDIAYDSEYFDQAHFIHATKKLTDHTPKDLQKAIPGFRFLQF